MTLSYDKQFEAWYEINKNGKIKPHGEPDCDGVVMNQGYMRKFADSLQKFLATDPNLERLKSFSRRRLVKIIIEDK